MPGPVETAIRARLMEGQTLTTLSQHRPFVLKRIDPHGIILLLGAKQAWTPLSWAALEGVLPFLAQHPGWVPAGGKRDVRGEVGTLDEYLKRFIKRDTARWVAALLDRAGVVEVRDDPVQLRARGVAA